MKRTPSLSLFLVLFAFTRTAFCQNINPETEYKWNKLEIVTETRQVDIMLPIKSTWSSYGNQGSTSTSPALTLPMKSQFWYLTKGGDRISEVEFLRLIRKNEHADNIERSINDRIKNQSLSDWKKYFETFSAIGLLCSLLSWVAPNYTGENRSNGINIGLGAFLIFGGVSLLLPYQQELPNHFISHKDAGYEVDVFNQKLREKLGINIEGD